MKLNKILMAVAAMAIVGCSSDDLMDFTANQAPEQESGLIQLDPNFAIAGVGVEDATTTRTHWEWNDPVAKDFLVNKFLPIYTAGATFAGTLNADADLTKQAVGLCWLGEGAAQEKVFTNYQFYHFGWLNKGETEAKFECDELTNGALYSEITMAGGTVSKEAIPGTDWVAAGLPAKAKKAGADNLNYNSGVYKTDNKSIFGGQYIVYYPFNEDFKNAGTIPAAAQTVFNPVPTTLDDSQLGLATFRYSAPVTIEGGAKASGFGLYNLSSLVQLKVITSTGDASIGKSVDQIVLWSESKSLLKQANLRADKIVAGEKGQALYDDTKVGTKTISAKFGTAININVKASAPAGAFITVLPTTVNDLKVLVHRTDGKWATIDKADTEFKAGSAKYLEIAVTDDDFTADYIAVDEASLTTALTEARLVATAAAPKTITVIGDITLATSPYNINNAKDANITIKGDDIIVPEAVTLNLNTKMESSVRVLGKACCGTATTGGRLDIQGGTVNNVTMEPTKAKVTAATYDAYNPQVTYSGAATIAADKTFDVQAGNVKVNAAVAHKGNFNVAEDAKVTVSGTGDLNFMGSTVVNDGTIEVEKAGKFDMTDANGNATATDGQRMTNNGKFIHNVDAGVGTAVQSMVQNGVYRCKVNAQDKLDDAFLQWTACSVIEMVNTAAVSYDLGTADGISPTAYKHNGKFIDIEVNSGALTTFTKVVKDDKEINIGNLTVTAGGLNINFLKVADGTSWRQRSLKVNGDMVVAAATTMTASKKISITGNLTVKGTGVKLTYVGSKANVDGLAVTKNITVDGNTADFDASATDALNITCANFYLKNKAQAEFGNRSEGDAKNLVVSGTISNPKNCTFDIKAAGTSTLLAWVTCTKLEVGGTFTGARPRVVE